MNWLKALLVVPFLSIALIGCAADDGSEAEEADTGAVMEESAEAMEKEDGAVMEEEAADEAEDAMEKAE